jgi:quercetin dioxygenase-like cupin family protein
MKVINSFQLPEDRVVKCPKGGFVSNRILLKPDNMGFSLTRTVIPVGIKSFWHYKNHLESNYCVSGRAILQNANTGEVFDIFPGVAYVLDNNDPHYFEAIEETTLICTFNPPLTGREIHDESGAYSTGFDDYMSPVYAVRSVPISKVTANDYNPNSVAPPEMALLETSIWEDGYTQPVVTVYDKDRDMYVVVDGFHRFLTLKNSKRINEREKGMLPVVVLKKEMSDRMASTIRHNRARGSHNVELMSKIVAELVEMGKGDRWICQHIGMSIDELLRLKQITGVAALFANRDFSDSWEAESEHDEVEEGISPI